MRIAILGTGLMGWPMARRLLELGHDVTAYNRTRSKAEGLAALDARVVDEPADAVDGADVVLTLLSDGPAVEAVLLGEPSRPRLAGRTVIQMSTIGPSESRRLAAAVGDVGGDYLEAPVLGSIPQATDGSLIVLVGAEPELFERCRPLLESFGPEPHLIGPVGAAAAVKLALNQLIAAETAAFSLSLGYLLGEGIDSDQFMGILRSSALYAPTFDKKLAAMTTRDFSRTNFPARLLLKDVLLMRSEAEAAGLETATLDGFARIVQRSVDLGHGDEDYSALFLGVVEPGD